MKLLRYAIAAFTAIVAVSCGKEQSVDIVPDKPGQIEVSDTTSPSISEKQVSLHAIVSEDKETKVLTDNSGAFKWQNGDHITVATATDILRQFETTDTGKEADFGGTIPDADNVGKYALYPASDNHLVDGDEILFHLDNEVVWSPNATNMPMLGKISGSGVGFKAVGGALKLVLYNIPSAAKYLQFVATKQITGDFEIANAALSGITIATGDTDKGADKELLINFSSSYEENMVFYIPLPVGTIGGFTLNILDESYGELFTKSTKPGVELSIVANHLVLGPSLNCVTAAADDVLTSTDITSSGLTGSYGDVEIVSATGKTWSVNACKQSDFLQLRSGSGSHIELPTYPDNIKSITLKNTRNAAGTPAAYSGTIHLRKDSATGDVVTSKNFSSLSVGDDIVLTIPSGYKTGFITTNAGLRVDGITVAFDVPEATKPIITTGFSTLTVAIGSTTASTSASITNPVDDLGIGFEIKDVSSDWISEVTIEEGVLKLTAKDSSNPNPDDNTATLVLRASGAANKEIALKQTSALVRKPASISAVEGNASFSASWAKADHATGYKAYLHTSETPTPETGGEELTPSLVGSTYSVSRAGLTNGATYYLYVKVDAVDANYYAEDAYTMVSFVPVATVYYEKVTSNLDDWSGDYLIVWGSNVHYGIGSNGLTTNASVSISDNRIAATGHDSHKVTIEKVSTSYYIKLPSGKYVTNASGSNTCEETESRTQAYTFAIDASGNALITGAGNKILQKNSSYYRFYNSNNSYPKPMLFKYAEPRTPAGIEWQKGGLLATTDTGELCTGDDTMPTATLTNPHSLSIEYTSSNTDVATINSSTGVITLVGGGETVISARFAGDATYATANVSYTLTVTDSRTTCASPAFSPAEGEVAANTSVSISSTTTGSTIYYTTDGTEPTTASSHGTAGAASASVTIDVAKTVKAIAVKEDWKTSAVESATYTIAGASLSPGTVLYSCDFGTSALATFSSYTGGTSYNSASTITYSCKSNNTKIMCETGGSVVTNMTQANLMVGGKNGGSGEWAKIAGIKTYGATQVTVRWSSNNNVVKVSVAESSTDAVTSANSTSNSGIFSLDGDEGTITLVFTAGSANNGRIDDIVVEFTAGSGSGGGGGGGVPPTPSGLPKYLGCYEMPAIESMLNGESASGTNASRGDTWYRYNTNNAKRQIATHTFAHPVSSDEVRTYTVLYDESNYAPLWCAHAMHTSMWPKNDIDRGSWTTDPAISLDQQTGLDSPYSSTISRGHFVAAQYRKCSEDSMDQTFYYTNQAPQNQSFNGGLWAQLETQIVNAAPSGTDTLYVVTGVLYDDDWYAEDPGNRPKTYPSGNGKTVPYPSHFYVCLMKCSFSSPGVVSGAIGCAYLCTNEAKPSNKVSDLPGYQYTIDYIETLAGFDFFANVPTAIQTTAESTKTSLW